MRTKTKMIVITFLFTVSVDGIEPSTSVLSGQRSTTELHAQSISLTTLENITEKYSYGKYTSPLSPLHSKKMERGGCEADEVRQTKNRIARFFVFKEYNLN